MTKEDIGSILKAVLPAILVSALFSGSSAVMTQQVQSRILNDNIEATKQLSEAVVDLRLQLGVFAERYITREELDRRLKEYKRSYPDGT